MVFRLHELRELIKLIDESSIDEFVVSDKGAKVVIKKSSGQTLATTATTPAVTAPVEKAAPVAAPVATPAVVAPVEEPTKAEPTEDLSQYHKIVSPIVGTFYAKSSPDADPFVKEGDQVNKDSVVCIVEAMKLFNEIEAEVSGTIVKVLVENGQLVEYNQPLFLVKTN
ncbi:acetyl-CoA carboxylase biotin carboxyl carrier protein [Risungbinella massiliensis]|uniref:acetyl-CoA carboxylase biotin carboxyl carrier protein n=1 Tax=Risungbinella massiliensis TaxID=1329796 RepID=UPI0005CC45D1|nr:acetyl-CoA carboxylase biotin carboxyl carrier protein [Risungbinella massiliensis]